MKIGTFLSALGVFGASFLASVPAEAAQSVEDFYKSKRLTVLIGSGAGGGYDVYARLLMRYMVKYILGHPTAVVQNQAGAAGVHATNLLANKSDRDGSVILATYNNLTIQPLLNAAGIQFDPRTLSWIGSIAKLNNVCITWHTSPVKTFEQAKEREIVLSSTGVTSNSTAVPHLLNRLTGTKFKVINGYSTSAQRLAVERGEVEGTCLSYSTFKASNPEWIENKKINLLVQVGLSRHPDIPEVPLATRFPPRSERREGHGVAEYPTGDGPTHRGAARRARRASASAAARIRCHYEGSRISGRVQACASRSRSHDRRSNDRDDPARLCDA
jgi:tripartite-type tricarboxylate transporter receptor subunit TctC